MKITDFSTLTFDCYGTLIDWETGLLAVLRPWADRHRLAVSDDDLLAAMGRHESRLQRARAGAIYPDLLADLMRALGDDFRVRVSDAEATALGASIKDWPAFPDSPEALRYLAGHYRLVVLSNVDNASFVHSNAKLGVTFDAVYTAEDIGSYKPDPRNFHSMLDKLGEQGIAKGDILHTAQSLFHDIEPAKAIGLVTNWINRRHDKPGPGATPPATATPDFEFPSLAAFAAAHRAASSGR